MLPILLFTLLGAFVAVVVAVCVGGYRLVGLLRRDHPAVWESLRRPTPWFTRFEELSAWHGFLFREQYRTVQDARVQTFGRVLRVLHRLAYGLAGVLLVLAVVVKVVRHT